MRRVATPRATASFRNSVYVSFQSQPRAPPRRLRLHRTDRRQHHGVVTRQQHARTGRRYRAAGSCGQLAKSDPARAAASSQTNSGSGPQRQARTRAPVQQAAAPSTPPPVQGTLPIVTDQFATVTVVPNEEIRRSGATTLGDLLLNKPGITASSFAPGASSRPIIRGLDVNRVGIVENGIGGSGASDLGEDHFVPIDPLTTNQVEVIRGPATLRYGSQSIGGVVSATNNRIPDALPLRDRNAVSDLRPASEGAAQCRLDQPLCQLRDTKHVLQRRYRPRRRGAARRWRQQFCDSRRRLLALDQQLRHPELSLPLRAGPRLQRPAAEYRNTLGRRPRSAAPTCSTAALSASR